MMQLLRNKTLVAWVVGITIAGTVLAYVPLIFIPPEQPPTSPENPEPLVSSTPPIVVTSTVSTTEEQTPVPPFTGPLRLR